MNAQRILVLMYHRVGEAHNDWERKYCIGAQRFAEHLRTLARTGWRAVSIDDFFTWQDNSAELPEQVLRLIRTIGSLSRNHNSLDVNTIIGEQAMLERTEIPTATSELYDQRYAGDYMDTDAYSVWGHGDLRTQQVLDTLSAVQIQPQSILDYGCGVGAWLGLLSRAFPDARISGVDISKTAIEKARDKFPQHRLESFNGLTAPFEDAQFDLVFSYHVLEHVDDIDASILDISRMLTPGGYAVIIFPCGNEGSFLDRTMRLISNSRLPTTDNRMVLFFETADGHVRRMTSSDTVAIFEKNGLKAITQFFSGHLFGTIDWLCRGTGPAYINRVFLGQPAIGRLAKARLALTRRLFLAIHRLILRKSLDLTKKRNPLKQTAVFVVKQIAKSLDCILNWLVSFEWRFFKHQKQGTAQYLVFRKV